jgi:serine protease inhibitor
MNTAFLSDLCGTPTPTCTPNKKYTFTDDKYVTQNANVTVNTNMKSILDNTLLTNFRKDGQSFAYSPYSMNYVLLMAYIGMDGITKKEFETVYGLPDNNKELINEMADINYQLLESGVKSTTTTYIDNAFRSSIDPEYIHQTHNKNTKITLCDFKNSSKTECVKINALVAIETNNLIQEIVTPSIVTSDTVLLLMNTLYLKLDWAFPFHTCRDHPFKKMDNSETSVKLMSMNSPALVKYFENDMYQAISLPYGVFNAKYSMIVVLPTPEFTPVTNFHDFHDVKQNLNLAKRNKMVVVQLAKFTQESEFMLNDMLEDLGMSSLFSKEQCNLGKMTNCNDIYVNSIVQKVVVQVDEKGTTAVAASSVAMNYRSGPDETFITDRPFQYFIVHDSSDTVLFSGMFNG